MNDIEAAQMSLDVEDGSDSTNVVAAGDVGQMSWFVCNPADDLVLFKIVSDGISLLDIGMSESDGSGVVSDKVWDFVWSNGFLDNFTELEVGFSIIDLDQGESSLFVVEKSEVFCGFDNSQDIHNTDWEFGVSSDLIIDSKSCLFILGDDSDFLSVPCVS